jgi:hypothetical protein
MPVDIDTSSDLDLLLTELRRRHWTLYLWGPRDDPEHFAAVFKWPGGDVDVLILREDGSASAYRTIYFDETEMFRPDLVIWQRHYPSAYRTLREVFSLPEPGAAGTRFEPEVPDARCLLPANLPASLAIRPLGMYR